MMVKLKNFFHYLRIHFFGSSNYSIIELIAFLEREPYDESIAFIDSLMSNLKEIEKRKLAEELNGQVYKLLEYQDYDKAYVFIAYRDYVQKHHLK
ncbi:hypothetical protein MASR2M15_27460 [Anaerolineales bacterium]